MSLYTKYRPRDWNSVIGQDAISNILRTSLIQDRVGHAYILTGSRGTGKTTTARILAKGINCKNLQDGNPCHECEHCIAFDNENMLDCIEIDGASNNGVENVRDLIEKARFEPNQGKYKIYIIDEVHMLSTGAFNALLKTLEEPPKHVKFILATTEIDKVPETIRSRSLRFDFKKISEADIVKRLGYVCKEEGIKVEKEALDIIARAARGALRDALTLTEQNTVNNEINTEYVRSTLSLIEDSLIDEIIDTIVSCDKSRMIELLDTLRNRHAEVRNLFDQILYSLRDRMIQSFLGKNSGVSFDEYSQIFSIFESAYSKIRVIPDGWLLIEITLLRAVARNDISISGGNEGTKHTNQMNSKNDEKKIISTKKETIQDTTNSPEVPSVSTGEFGGSISEDLRKKSQTVGPRGSVERGSFGDLGNRTENRSQNESEEIKTFGTFSHKSTESTTSEIKEVPTEGKKESKTTPTTSLFSYIRLLEEVKKTKASLVPDLKTARFELDGTSLTLIFTKEWHYNRVNKADMKNALAEILESTFGGTWNIECRLDGSHGANIADEVF